MTCIEPDKIDEMWPPEIGTLRESERLFVKAFSITSAQIHVKYVKQAAENLRLVLEKLDWQDDADA